MKAGERRRQPAFTEISSLDVASLLLGIIFCFRVEVLKSWPVSSLLEAGLLCVPWSILLLLPFIIAVQKPRILSTFRWPAWGTIGCFAAILVVYLLSFQNPSTALSQWDSRSGLRFGLTEGLLTTGLGLAAIYFGWARQMPTPRQVIFVMVPVLFLAQQIRASFVHPLDWWRSNMLPVIEMAWHTLGKGENPYDSTLMIKQLLYWPGMLLMHGPGVMAGWDPRIIPIAAGAGALAILGTMGRDKIPLMAVGMAGLYLGTYMYARDDVHVPVLWLVMGLSLWALRTGRDRTTGLLWGLAIGSREWFWLLTPFWVFAVLESVGRARTIKILVWTGITALIIMAPVLFVEPEIFLEGQTQRGDRLQNADYFRLMAMTLDFGFSWIFVVFNIRSWTWWIQLPLYGICLFLGLRKKRTPSGYLLWGALSIVVSQFFNTMAEPYHFLFPAYVLLGASALDVRSTAHVKSKLKA